MERIPKNVHKAEGNREVRISGREPGGKGKRIKGGLFLMNLLIKSNPGLHANLFG